jgi:hypothetical protein
MKCDFDNRSSRALLSAVRSGRDVQPFCALNPTGKTVLTLRHDVDRFPSRALAMAKEETKMDMPATYLFRAKWHVLREALGHETGYHYALSFDR